MCLCIHHNVVTGLDPEDDALPCRRIPKPTQTVTQHLADIGDHSKPPVSDFKFWSRNGFRNLQRLMMKQTKEDHGRMVNIDQTYPSITQQLRQTSFILGQLTNDVREVKLGLEDEITALSGSEKLDHTQNQDLTRKGEDMYFIREEKRET
jgi:hypothetical protein